LWNGICEAAATSEEEFESKAQLKSSILIIPTSNKECAIWMDKE
jgi:hypothetical protein